MVMDMEMQQTQHKIQLVQQDMLIIAMIVMTTIQQLIQIQYGLQIWIMMVMEMQQITEQTVLNQQEHGL